MAERDEERKIADEDRSTIDEMPALEDQNDYHIQAPNADFVSNHRHAQIQTVHTVSNCTCTPRLSPIRTHCYGPNGRRVSICTYVPICTYDRESERKSNEEDDENNDEGEDDEETDSEEDNDESEVDEDLPALIPCTEEELELLALYEAYNICDR